MGDPRDRDEQGSSEPSSAVEGLVVYGADWCPDVRRSRQLLDSAGVPYRYVNLEEDRVATKLVRRLQKGRRRIPTLVWPDGTVLVEPSDEELRDRMGRGS